MKYIDNTDYKYVIAHRICERMKKILEEYTKDLRYRYEFRIYTNMFGSYVGLNYCQCKKQKNNPWNQGPLIEMKTDSCRIVTFLTDCQTTLRVESDVNKATIETAISNIKLMLQDMDRR